MKILVKRNTEKEMSLPKLNRVIGQLEGVKRMIETNRSCADILTQLRSVRGAVKAIESRLLGQHLEQCVCQSFSTNKEREKVVKEVSEFFSRFEN